MLNNFTFPLAVNADNTEIIKEVEEAAQKLHDKKIEALPYSTFSLFRETGSRVEYEEQYMEHRKMLCAFCAMVLLDKGEKWLYKLCDIIFAICDEYTWALPAHLRNRETSEEIITTIDLFASETAFALAEVHYTLRDKLPQGVLDRMEYELKRRIVAPYLQTERRFGISNWSGVCASGVGATLMYLGLNDEFEKAKKNLFINIKDFLDSFPEDGCCLEGSLYWFYGFSHFCYLAELLCNYTDGKINYFEDEKVKKIAFFINNIYLEDNFVIPFSDSSHTYNYNPGILCLLASKYDGIYIPPKKYMEKFENSARYRFVTFLRNLYLAKDLPEKTESKKGFFCYPESGWYINKSKNFVLAAKAGHNDEPHNHNDVGSFVVFDDGRFILDDAGWAKYDSKYFVESERYSGTKATTSSGHSLPVIDECAQKFGREFCGKILCADEKAFALEYSAAYGIEGLSLLERRFDIFENGIKIKETAKGDIKKLTFRFTTRLCPEIRGNKIIIENYTLSCAEKADISLSHYDFEPRFAGFGTEGAGKMRVYLIDFGFDVENGHKEAVFTLSK